MIGKGNIIVTTATTTTTQKPSVGRRIGSWALNHGALVGLIILCIALFIATPVFLTVPNIINIGIQAAVVAIMAFGMTFVIVTSGIDLSVGSVAALSAMVSAWMFSNVGLPGWLTLIIGLLIGLLAGAASGLAIAYGKLPAFIATLAMMSVARGLTLVISGGTPVATSGAVNHLGADLGPIPVPVIMLALARGVLVHPVAHGARPVPLRHRWQRGGCPTLRYPGASHPRRRLRSRRSVRWSGWPGSGWSTVLGSAAGGSGI